jgi:hypothetical protein
MAVADKSAFKFTSALWACKYFRRYKKKVRRLRGRKVLPRGAAARQKKKIILRRFFHKKFDYLEFFGDTTLEKLYGTKTKALRSLRKKILSNGALQLLRHYGNLALTTPVSRKWGMRPRLRRAMPAGAGFKNMFNIGGGRNYRRLVIYIPEFQRIRAATIKKLKRTVRRTGEYTPGLFQFFRSAHAKDSRARFRRLG